MANSRDVLSRLKDYEKGVANTDTLGGDQEMVIISESGLYRLIMTSRKPQAEPFQDWVCQEVLPSIRKTGKYEVKRQPIQLPPVDIRVVNLVNALETAGVWVQNPRFNQAIQDLILDKILGVVSNNALPPAEIWLGVVEKAEDLGYSIALVTANRSALGKYVAAYSLEKKQEKRACNGTMRLINLYKDCEELEEAIKSFMDAKVLASASSLES
jgi:hypothetical protein